MFYGTYSIVLLMCNLFLKTKSFPFRVSYFQSRIFVQLTIRKEKQELNGKLTLFQIEQQPLVERAEEDQLPL